MLLKESGIMKIRSEMPWVTEVYGKHTGINKTEKAKTVINSRDILSLSNQGKEYQAAIKAVKDIPDVRTDKIKGILKRYQAGTYDVKGSEIAEKIAASIIDKKV